MWGCGTVALEEAAAVADRWGARRRSPGSLESEVLAALWAASSPMTVGEVQKVLGGGLAYNTVHTILVRLHDKGVVQRSPGAKAGTRAHAYRPTLGAEEMAAEQMQALLERGADHQAVLQRFVTSLSPEDEAALRRLLEAGQ